MILRLFFFLIFAINRFHDTETTIRYILVLIAQWRTKAHFNSHTLEIGFFYTLKMQRENSGWFLEKNVQNRYENTCPLRKKFNWISVFLVIRETLQSQRKSEFTTIASTTNRFCINWYTIDWDTGLVDWEKFKSVQRKFCTVYLLVLVFSGIFIKGDHFKWRLR